MNIDEYDTQIRRIKRRIKEIRDDMALSEFERDDESEKVNERLVKLEENSEWMTREIRELRTAQRAITTRLDKMTPRKE